MVARRVVAPAVGVLLLWFAWWLVGGPVGQFEKAAGLVGVSGRFTADKCMIPRYEDGPPASDCRGVFRPDGGGTTNERARIWSGAPVRQAVRAVCEGDECHRVSASETARTLTLIGLALLPGAVGLALVGVGLAREEFEDGGIGTWVGAAGAIAVMLLVVLLMICGALWIGLGFTGL
ncbi:hypothetical protein ACFXDE_12950 [Kitasatospora sp. NPDC059408]|uniref:hypothetical protein n=1 Tax=Kitasatospora sp. NPDC059408 TaxID=3346823 RepID=UPI0036A0C4A5